MHTQRSGRRGSRLRKGLAAVLIGLAALSWGAMPQAPASEHSGTVPGGEPVRREETQKITEPNAAAPAGDAGGQAPPASDASPPSGTGLPRGEAQVPAEQAHPHPEDTPADGAPVEDDYFADAVFLGDSRTEGFSLYSGLKQGTYLYAVGATVESVFSKKTQTAADGTSQTLMDALAAGSFSKVYVMLGINELGWPRIETFSDQYSALVDRIRELQPDAQIALESILPVSAGQEAKGSYVNNERIAQFNAVIRQLAEERECTYLNVAEALTDASGCLPDGRTWDGIHLNVEGCQQWLAYLRAHPL